MGKEEDKEPRCVLTLPLYPEPWQADIIEKRFRIMEHIENSLTALELRKLKNVERTKKYREVMSAIKEEKDDKKRNKLWKERNKLLKDAGISQFDFIKDISSLQKHFASHIAQKVGAAAARSHVWSAFDKVVFGKGQRIHFHKKGDLKSITSGYFGVSMAVKNGYFIWSGGTKDEKDRKVNPITISIKIK
jgi:hypothetical protein